METLISGNVLLVGEGDFSFAVSLVEKLPSNKSFSILATSLETENSIKKHQYAHCNISNLKQKGVIVRLETDATVLHNNPETRGQRFDCIIFNFPHAGGKSNHKKNRKLLNDFFASAVQVLKGQGQIFVTLCKGQGGTPADKPMRAWHDSWQVVSMAANSGLILNKILTFQAEDYTVYTSTGFRSLDKGFNTENALTHVFEMAEPVPVPIKVENKDIMVGKNVLSCPPYMYNKLKQIRSVNSNMDHPINKVYSEVVQDLQSTVRDIKVENLGSQPPLTKIEPTVGEAYTRVMRTTRSDTDLKIDDENISGTIVDAECDNVSCEHKDKDEIFTFKHDTLDYIHNTASETIVIKYVPVCKPALISENQSALSYHMVISWPITPDLGEIQVTAFSSAQNALTRVVREKCEHISNLLNDVISESKNSIAISSLTENKMLSDGTKVMHACDFLVSKVSESVSSTEIVGHCHEMNKIGECLVTELTDEVSSQKLQVFFTVNLNKLVCLKYNVDNEKLWWSEDHRVLSQFSVLANGDPTSNQESTPITIDTENGRAAPECSNQAKASVINAPSLYPMKFQHDMSFWENPSVAFNEVEYCDIIRDIADDCVIDVELIDKYIDSSTERTSRCYRLTFQSIDKALSYDTSWKLQSLIRLEVAKKMSIVLR